MAQRLEEGQQDPLHIFSEFDDPTRQQLIAKIVQNEPHLRQIPRQNLYALWFSEITVLQKMANAQTKSERRAYSFILMSWSALYDVAGELVMGKLLQPVEQRLLKALLLSAGCLSQVFMNAVELFKLFMNAIAPTRPTFPRPTASLHESASHGYLGLIAGLPTESGIRDGRQCVVTKRGQPLIESTHILPKRLNGTQHEYLLQSNCWPWLQAFWGEEKVNKLQSLLLSEEGTMDMERLYNRITLEIHVHRYWDRAMCALRPIWVNEDRTEMQIAFHWLPLKENIPGAAKHLRSDFVSTTENPYQDPKYRPRETPGGNNVVFHTETGARISSGYVFTVKTDNKRERPLPSMELLEIRWHLSRIACMQGNAEDEDNDYESDGGSVSVRSGSRSLIVDTN
ncbi:hypothetical protein PENPOL_c002G00700 [Penicillium polonicum]|uniref:HNH nuclease domain-containing protein n=1 Tax=Penicillium polonicum TaxID=60169 RepID=A0A1V6NYL6_PENPO|nr:hypothetical protein PENPOL_c002G00700 [Penicillium polonicum]